MTQSLVCRDDLRIRWNTAFVCKGEHMVRQIVRDPFFLQQKSEPATEADKQVVQDLIDTLNANHDRCVGMAANMIGVKRQLTAIRW